MVHKSGKTHRQNEFWVTAGCHVVGNIYRQRGVSARNRTEGWRRWDGGKLTAAFFDLVCTGDCPWVLDIHLPVTHLVSDTCSWDKTHAVNKLCCSLHLQGAFRPNLTPGQFQHCIQLVVDWAQVFPLRSCVPGGRSILLSSRWQKVGIYSSNIWKCKQTS